MILRIKSDIRNQLSSFVWLKNYGYVFEAAYWKGEKERVERGLSKTQKIK